MDDLATGQHRVNHRAVALGQGFLGSAGAHHQQSGVLGGQRLQASLFHDPAQQALVEVVAAERGVAAGGHHLEHALGQLEHGDVEGAATEIVNRVDPFGRVIEAIGDGRRSRLIEQAQHFQAGQLGCVLGGLALGVIEIGRHRDYGADEIVAE
ncbi:NAD-specific glutamate dehydrogenase [compost metagenome]